MTPQLGATLAAAGLVAGLMLALVGVVGTRGPARPDPAFGRALRRLAGIGLPAHVRSTRQLVLVAGASVVVGGWLYSGIPMVGIGAGVAVVGMPWLFGAGRAEARMIDRLEAVEVWTRRLSDLVRSGAGLHQAIVVGAADAPAAIASEVNDLAMELRGEISTVEALRRFADRLADAHSDEVIAALMLNARERGPRLGDVLDRVSENIADVVTMLREQSSNRTDARISGLVLSALTLGGLLIVLINKSYMRPYHSLTGQAVLAACLVGFASLLLWCRALNMPRRIPRLLRSGSTRGGRP